MALTGDLSPEALAEAMPRRPPRASPALLRPDAGASRETLALVRSAVRNDPAQQDAAERAAQARRLAGLAGGD